MGGASGGGSGAGAASGSLSLASLGFSALSSIASAKGTQAGDEAQATRLDRAVAYGKVKAAQTGAQLTENLNTTLGNIDVVRAAGNTDPTAPTAQALQSRTEYLGDRYRNTAVDNILAQTEQDSADADYLRHAGKFAMGLGYINAAAGVAKGLGQTDWTKFGFGGGGAHDPSLDS